MPSTQFGVYVGNRCVDRVEDRGRVSVWGVQSSQRVLVSAPDSNADEAFPLRDKYPNVSPISGGKLVDRYDEALIVDVRSTAGKTIYVYAVGRQADPLESMVPPRPVGERSHVDFVGPGRAMLLRNVKIRVGDLAGE